jgi:hypothetical protein
MTISSFLIIAILLLPVILIGILFYRLNRSQQRRVRDMQEQIFNIDDWPGASLDASARILARQETISPQAKGIAKVDLELEIQPLEGAAHPARTTWLVEVEALEEVAIGKIVPVKISRAKSGLIYPNFPHAKAWIFENK